MQDLVGGSTVYVFGGGILVALLLGFLIGRLAKSRRSDGMGDAGTKVRQDQFIMLASHYLLTPLSIIQTALASLQEADMSLNVDQRHRLYDAIQAGQKRLWIVAEEMVLVNEIEHSTLEPQFAPSDVSDVISAAIADVDVFARVKNLAILFHDMSGQFHEARLDARRMRQAVIAILDNAIKFSEIGDKVEIQLICEEGFYNLIVKDTGVGMDEQARARLGERFFRGSSLYNFNYEGMGLGLHIAYAIFKAHGGSMSIMSEVNVGTTVTARFPML